MVCCIKKVAGLGWHEALYASSCSGFVKGRVAALSQLNKMAFASLGMVFGAVLFSSH